MIYDIRLTKFHYAAVLYNLHEYWILSIRQAGQYYDLQVRVLINTDFGITARIVPSLYHLTQPR